MTPEMMTTQPATIRAYFEKVRQLAKDGNEFPIDISEVWPLVYPRKDHAIRVLRKEFIQDVDFQIFPIFGEKGRPEESYRLTVPCLEFFIARKVREVFDVYRQVFHKVADQSEALPASQDELILMLAQRNVDTARRVAVLEDRVERIVQIQQEAHDNLTALPAPTEPMAEIATEDKIRRMVNLYATATSTPAQDVWRLLYTDLYYRYHVQVNNFALKKGESKLQAIKRHGHLDKLWLISGHILKVSN